MRTSCEEIRNIGVDTIDKELLDKEIVFEKAWRFMILM